MKYEEKKVIDVEAEDVQDKEDPVVKEMPVVDEYWLVKKPKFLCKTKKVKKEKEPKEKKGVGKKILVGAGIAVGTILVAGKVLMGLTHSKDQIGDEAVEPDDSVEIEEHPDEGYFIVRDTNFQSETENPVEEKTEE